ncbi:MAG: nitroreductase family protein [Candidatus Bathyarchaeota archaeon]|nr:MAG: nitroreductase family protein [Candidatus Bathyarchaeota archaeon]
MRHVFDLAKSRKTVRKFSAQVMDWNKLKIIVKTACQAPSGANSQPWKFLIVTDKLRKKQIREACEQGEKEFHLQVNGEFKKWLHNRGLDWKKPFLEHAPLLLLIFSEKQAPYSTQSVWLAIGYILLIIEELGLNTITYTPSITEDIRDLLDIPETHRLEAILPIGVSEDDKTKEPKKEFSEVTYINSWGCSPEIKI